MLGETWSDQDPIMGIKKTVLPLHAIGQSLLTDCLHFSSLTNDFAQRKRHPGHELTTNTSRACEI